MTTNTPYPPRAAQRPHVVHSPWGERIDPWYWLRDDERRDPDVIAYLEAENAYRLAATAPLRDLEDTLYTEIVGRVKQDDASVPYRKGGYWYYRRFESGGEHPVYARRADADGAAEEVLLDGNRLSQDHAYFQVGALEVSPDGRMLAWCEDIVGRRQYRLRVRDLASGTTLATVIDDVETDIAWANDNRTLLYVAKDPGTLLGLYVRALTIGAGEPSDRLVFEQTDHSFYTGVSRSKSGRYLFISMESTVASEWRFADASDPSLAFQVFLPWHRDHEYQVDHAGGGFIVRSNWQAPNFRLLRAEARPYQDPGEWQELLAHRDEVFIEDFEAFDTFVATALRAGGLARVGILPLGPQPGAEYLIPGDEPASTMGIDVNAEPGVRVLRYAYTSLATPNSVCEFDLDTGQRRLLKRDPVQGRYDPADYVTEHLFVAARDGARIPVSLVHRRGVSRDGSAPLLLYAYGAYGLSMDPAFSVARVSLLDRGFVFAIAHVRGGQEMGRRWYDEGRMQHKMNSFTDYIDVTRALVGLGYAARDRVIGVGGSAGGLLIAAVANMSPQDYRALVAQVPFVDVVTTMLDDSIPLTSNEYDEWGNPAQRDSYEAMLRYSPYDNVRAQAYPALYVTTGLWDSQVQYYEPAKWVAKLRAMKTDANPLYLRVDMEAGHGGKAGRFQRYREVAAEYAFMLGQVTPAGGAASAPAAGRAATPGAR